jgi:hypothetical protein
MIPSAKMVSFSIAPPENMFIMPKSVPPWVLAIELKKAESAAASIPGVGT